VVLYELLTGKQPFPAATMMSVMYAHVHTPPPDVTSLRPDCPPDVAAAVMRMLEKDPAARWPSLEAAVAAIGAVTQSQDETTRSQLITLARSGRKPMVVRHSTPRSPIPLGRSATPAPTVRTAPPVATPAPAPAQRSQLPLAAGILGAGALLAAALYFAPRRQAAAPVEPPPPAAAAAPDTTTAPSAPAPSLAPATGGPGASAPARPAPAERPAGGTAAARDKERVPPRREARADGGTPTPGPAPATMTASASVTMEEPAPVEASTELSGGAALLNTPRGAAVPSPDTRSAIERSVASYARALADGDAAGAVAMWPEMPAPRRDRLEREFAEGLRYASRWRITDLKVDGSKATARLRGNTTDVRNGTVAGSRAVDEDIVLVRRGSGWRLQQIAQ
jgi:hypothetical protein